jgi:pyridoxine/pyridoxamine 5'-phosphate oxidase
LKDTEELKKAIKDLLSSQNLAVIATQKEGRPFTNLVAFAATDDLKHLVFATNRATRKYANLMADSRMSMLIDNRQNQASDFHNATAVAAIGRVEEVKGPEKADFMELYLSKHSHLKAFATAPTCALIKLRVDRYNIVRRFQNVTELWMTQ